MALLAVGVGAAVLCRNLPIPYSVVLVLIGLGLEPLAEQWPTLTPLLHFRLTPELVLFIFLPTLIFESSCNLNARQLFKDLAPILIMAVPALLLSTFIIGLGLWWTLSLNLGVALLFGALISATDPVAVIALFKELGTPQRLTVLVEGESLFNDATAIVLFTLLLGLVVHDAADWNPGFAVFQFIQVFGGGLIVGIFLGWTVSGLMARFELNAGLVILLSVIMAYVAFIVAEHGLHVSGVMATAASALMLSAFGLPRLPDRIGSALREVWEFLALIGNTLLFLLVGLSVNLTSLVSRLDIVLLAVGLVLAARAGTVYTLVPGATRLFGLPRVTLGERHILWWGGLKGGLAIAMALSIPPDLPERQLLLDLTVGVVLFTLLINAPTIRPLLQKLGINRLNADEQVELNQGVAVAQHQLQQKLGQLHNAGLLSRAAHHQIRNRFKAMLTADLPVIEATDQEVRQQRLEALRAEVQALDDLYQVGTIRQATFLDLQSELQMEREQIADAPDRLSNEQPASPSRWRRLEIAVLQRLWEQDWAVGLLSRYQNWRLSHYLTKSMARILMTEAALQTIRQHPESAPRKTLEHLYHQRLQKLRADIADIQQDFPEFSRRFEVRLASQAALIAAMRAIDEEYRHRSLGAKAYTQLEERIHKALQAVPPVSMPLVDLHYRDWVSMVPLFSGLPDNALQEIARQAMAVNFLAGDTIISQDSRGDALYIVIHGCVSVTQRLPTGETRQLAELRAGEFVGETALLGNHLRTANVHALRATTVLRLTRKEVLALAERFPELAQRLRDTEQVRALGRREF
ncbi:MAG: cation:proton antiporter [Candidatus Competibacteraceae bacterium]|jgi:CPA1 family monovalent cation:H+ antiporter|nr:cation:proton antiporter [Candidatus Competibacteraceae bacterium]